MKLRHMFLSIATLLIVTPVANAAFSDVPQTHPNFIAISYLENNGTISGYEDGTYKPDKLVNRAEAMKIILSGSNISVPEYEGDQVFSDVPLDAWYQDYVVLAKEAGIISGNPDGTFAPGRTVIRAEFLKMLLKTNRFREDKWQEAESTYDDVSNDDWFAPYMLYAGHSGIVTPTAENMLLPSQEVTRSQVAEMMYLLTLILRAKDVQFMVDQAKSHMAIIDGFIKKNDIYSAKRSSELAVDLTQQAITILPENKDALANGKLAKAFDFVLVGYISASSGNTDTAKEYCNKAIDKATEAWEVDNNVQVLARLIKDRARGVLAQIEQ